MLHQQIHDYYKVQTTLKIIKVASVESIFLLFKNSLTQSMIKKDKCKSEIGQKGLHLFQQSDGASFGFSEI